jgi:hypothetical protein
MSVALWVPVAVGAILAAALMPALSRMLRNRLRGAPVAEIVATSSTTSQDGDSGAVRSVQTAEVVIPVGALEEIWSAVNLERLARTYWRFISRVTLGVLHVSYTPQDRAIVLFARPLAMIRFHPPEYELDPDRGVVRWRIAGGMLVARRGITAGGYLQIEVRRLGADDESHERVRVEVAVNNFYPSIAVGVSRRVYDATQSRIHVVVTRAFLRSLARLDLAESRVRSFQ